MSLWTEALERIKKNFLSGRPYVPPPLTTYMDETVRQLYPAPGRVSTIFNRYGDVLNNAGGFFASEWAEKCNNGRRFRGYALTFNRAYDTLYAVWQEKKEQERQHWLRERAAGRDTSDPEGESLNTRYLKEKAHLEELMEWIVFKNPRMGDLPWQEFFMSEEFERRSTQFAKARAGLPRSLWEAYGYSKDASIRKLGNVIVVHKAERDATSFGDRVEVLRFDTEGNRLSGGDVLWSVGRYSLAEEGASETIEGEGAAADSVTRSPLPSDGVKRLFEREIEADHVTWYPDGSLETIERHGGGAAWADWQRWQWLPATRVWLLLDQGLWLSA